MVLLLGTLSAEFPKTVTVDGMAKLSATIYSNKQTKNRKRYLNYTLAYPLLGKLGALGLAVIVMPRKFGFRKVKTVLDFSLKLVPVVGLEPTRLFKVPGF